MIHADGDAYVTNILYRFEGWGMEGREIAWKRMLLPFGWNCL
jgi:hypothetical protein